MHQQSVLYILSGLTVECIGKGQVQWSETETVGRDTETTYYQASENYYYHKATVFTESNSKSHKSQHW